MFHRYTYTETDVPLAVPKNESSKIPMPCHPMPRLTIDGGIIVALAYLEAPMKAPVDYKRKNIYQIDTTNKWIETIIW
jgi:hypothetical protein